MIEPLNFPPAPLKLVKRSGVVYVTCLVRKKAVRLTPEEWVRQHVLHYLLQYKHAPTGLVAVEKEILVNGLKRRFDVIVANHSGKVKVLVECKATNISLSEETVFQLAQYNSLLSAEFVMITNGIKSFIAQINQSSGDLVLFEDLPHLA